MNNSTKRRTATSAAILSVALTAGPGALSADAATSPLPDTTRTTTALFLKVTDPLKKIVNETTGTLAKVVGSIKLVEEPSRDPSAQ